ncbi:hypothetical protein BABINDRAFT_180773 [Babjeviella inositovora NRRL Y-12698]|uniref:C2H2-type domain-containing protein n=1 Tax=Babjeviella inositovora NRRL Y-12698 TaxID=984486 RepID=A0A1E3QMY8_9ASCO|nr:uncharacterized protein BABINDRAFT_180773 [Babjeviella inositovora NRRL Y-12698]ODQ79059.1 hypothetical protein BABINDRAFT_180773 [Babjeviella inositovora NRRL Y-12698]
MTSTDKKKQKRTIGHYPCNIPGCTKAFSRADHLQRHKLNHNPKTVYKCDWAGCGREFVRKDLKTRHMTRHTLRREKDEDTRPDDSARDSDYSTQGRVLLVPNTPSFPSLKIPHSIDHADDGSKEPNQDIMHWLFSAGVVSTSYFQDTNPYSFFGEFDVAHSPMAILDDLFDMNVVFVHQQNQTYVDAEMLRELTALVPGLAAIPGFTLPNVEQFLQNYWSCFHVQYPILHRPSLDTKVCPRVLLLALVMVGASFISCNARYNIPEAKVVAQAIAEPLRWMIFASRDFHPPAQAWVIQSLLLLEVYEKLCATRTLHERGHLHHATTIQLLKRSPISLRNIASTNFGDTLSEQELRKTEMWKAWIDAESMKRCAFMAFYIDNTHATLFDHQVTLFAHQMHLSLPCDEALWESTDFQSFDKEKKLLTAQAPHFLVALRKLLNRKCVVTGAFGKKILLAGLQSVAYQMVQRDLQVSFFGWDDLKDTWRETITLAFDVWVTDMCGSCLFTLPATVVPGDQGIAYYSPASTFCKTLDYHISQIYIRIDSYEYTIYAGVPWRMCIEAESDSHEHRAVEKKMKDWAALANARVAVMHAYFILWETFLSPHDDPATETTALTYSPDEDPFLGAYAIANAMLVVWGYNFALKGPENKTLAHWWAEHHVAPEIVAYEEDGHAYLRRIRAALYAQTDIMVHTRESTLTGYQFYHAVVKCSAGLLLIGDKHHVAGLCRLVSESLARGTWELICEHSKVIKHCGTRSLGSKRVKCSDMYATGEGLHNEFQANAIRS